MSSTWHGLVRFAAATFAQAARTASQARCSPAAASEALSTSSSRQLRLSSSHSEWNSARQLSTSAVAAAQAQRDDESDDEHLMNELQSQHQGQDAHAALLSALRNFQHSARKTRKGAFVTRQDDEMHYSLAPIHSMVGESEEDRAEFFRQWGRQLAKETTAIRDAVREYQENLDSAKARSDAAAQAPSQRIMREWYPQVVEAIAHEQSVIKSGAPGVDRRVHGPYLCLLKPQYLAVIAIHGLMDLLLYKPREETREAGRARFVTASMTLGKAVQGQVHLEMLKKKVREDNQRRRDLSKLWEEGKLQREEMEERGVQQFSPFDAETWRMRFEEVGETLPDDPQDWFKDETAFAERLGQFTKHFRIGVKTQSKTKKVVQLRKHAKLSIGPEALWDPAVQVKVGAALLNILINTAKIRDENGDMVPAFANVTEYVRRGSRYIRNGFMVAHPAVLNQVAAFEDVAKTSLLKMKPMLVPPVPWKSAKEGAYLTVRSYVLRARESREGRDLLAACDARMARGEPGCQQVYKALNILGSVPWRINQSVLADVETAWAAGGDLADLPSKEVVSPPAHKQPPSRFRLVRTATGLTAQWAPATSLESARQWYQHKLALKEHYEDIGLRCDVEYKLAVAREFKDEKRFYYPHSMDFRGRAYPMHPHLNHLSNDLCRGLLEFAEAKPLGEDGLRWLYIQVANLFGSGADKLPMAGRAQFGEEHLPQIFQTADDPLSPNSTWWLQADDPWQLLATCKDIAAALRSGDPASYLSRIPVHQDGSCNGLQHYAALGRDLSGGSAVNLTPEDKPQDVYTEIAKVVQAKVTKGIEAGDQYARLLEGEIDRKLVKQTVMTSVYGVTFIGARIQLANRLKERGWTHEPTIFRAATYAAHAVLGSLLDMFQNAKDIMAWLTQSAKAVAKAGHPVQWTTPLGLPIVQPYRNNRRQAVKTLLQVVVLQNSAKQLPVMKGRQKSAFPPNFIHSIDSSHMMLTAIACAEQGMAFAGVHDSFWTHACDVPRMNRTLREQFVALHSRPILEELLEQLQELYPDVDLPPLPPRGQLDLNQVLDSTYFFS